jgi:sorbitol-specific phosphotransferase system component IIBC
MSRALADITILAVVFAAATAIAEALGAANLGTAMGIGQIAFAMALVALLVLRR